MTIAEVFYLLVFFEIKGGKNILKSKITKLKLMHQI